ncbi:rho GTPase-activating protein 18 isoform X2 [Danio rerio]|uniref:Rho GTPase-activating protein 18 isoform X2 n=2 Tax=Danio rerio TaxID=7955 RepID=A0AC58I7C1_DANRE|nr:rho GTPase-activating protein 18 isoform X1 [Danio rerio]|eukprot:XP_001343601.7 rho GTPase-activating protein 18 isoform X1 [Danio rerio]
MLLGESPAAAARPKLQRNFHNNINNVSLKKMSRQQDVVLTAYTSNSEAVLAVKEPAEFPAASRRTGQYNVQRLRGPAAAPYQRCSSQDSLDEQAMVDYFKEVEIIQRSGDAETQEELQLKVADEGEQEEAWLMEAGLATLFDQSASDGEDSIALLSTLTRTQAAAVERRVETLKQTLRKRNKPYAVPDVREIFKPSTTAAHSKQDEAESTERSGSKKQEVEGLGNGVGLIAAGGGADTETDINLEVSFSEQALVYKEELKLSKPQCQADDRLPDFKVSQDKTGQTKVGDLSAEDMKKVRRLVLIEMSALFDTCGVEVKAHKALKVKVRESGLFGVPLSVLLDQDQRRIPGTKVPLILQHLISHIEEQGLDTEGVLRIPGAATRVKAVCHELEHKFYEGLFPWESLKQHDAASLLKLFIRELPYPLLTVQYFNAFISVLKLPTQKQQLQALNLLVLLLPEHNRDTLKALMEFFQRVIHHKDKNKMTLNNVAVVMAPNIFMCKGFRSKISEQQEFAMATGTANIVRLLIRYQNLLWTIPKFILNQVRKHNMENQRKMNRDRAVKKLLKKMAYDRERATERQEKNTEAEGGFIRVQAPQFLMVSMAIQLTEDLKASDVLTRFLSQERSVTVKREDLCLYEMGGNIKERCLDEETYIKALLELNPSAEWVIRSVQH